METNNSSKNDKEITEKSEPSREKRKSFWGLSYKDAALAGAPTLLIVSPIVGFILGYLTVKYWNWPLWVPVLTLIMGFVQGIRETLKMSSKVQKNNKNKK